ncbi:MAG: hypothetical protein LBQ96_06865, partial [Fusobacteriaceae bacterium]|nr:hypothetical protein [Fusobacteriaceae bacterium]
MKENPETRKNALLSSIWMKSVRLCALIPLVFLLVRNAAPATTAELEEKVASDQEALILSIETTREMVKDLLHENEQKIRDARRNEINLIRAGDFYSKPVYPSTQIFFMYLYEEQGKGKNNNKKEWKNTINAIAFRLQGGQTPKGKNPYSEGELRVGLTESLDPVPDKDKDPKIDGDPDYKSVFSFTPEPAGGSVTKSTMAYSPLAVTTSSDPQGALEGGNGVFIEEEPYMETVELGANIKPLNPTLPNITKDVTLNVGSATLTPPPTPTIPTVNPPGTVSATPVTPSTPGAISPVNLNPPTVNKPSTPQAPALSVPTAPTIAEYTPVTVVAPTAPSAPVVTPPGLPTFTLSAASAGSGDAAYFLDNKPTIGTRNTVISEIAITDGTFTATRNAAAGGFTYSFTGYKGYNIYPQSTANTTANGGIAAVATNATATIPDVTNVTTGTAARGMMRALVQAMWNNGDWTYNYTPAAADMGANKDVRELVHYDIHNQGPGNIARNTLKGRLAAAGASAELQNSYQYAEDMAAAARIIAFITSGDITMNGSNMTITNQYNHTSGHQAMHVNDGKIIVQNGSFNAIFMQGGDNNGNDGEIMYNGANGEIFINTYKSAGFAFGTVQNNANQNMPFLANDGLFVLSGDEGSAFYIGKLESGATPSKPNTKIKFNDDPIDRGYGNDTGMLYVFGDLSFGIFVPEKISQSVSSNAGKGIRVSVGGYDSGKFGSATPDDGITENAVGVAIKKQNTATTVELDYHEIHVNGNSKKSVGAVSLVDAGLNLHNGKISVNGGESNIGIYAGAISGDSGSSVTTTGDLIAGNGKVNQNWSGVQDGTGISISAVAIEGSDDSTGFGGSENFAASPGSTYNVAPTYQLATGTGVNIVAYAKGGLDITAANLGGMGSENTVGVYAEGKNGTDASTITITNDVEIIGMTVTTGATNAIAAFAKDGGEISLTNNRLASSSGTKFSDNRLIMDQYPDIEITGK